MSENATLTGYPSIDKPWLKYYSKEAVSCEVPELTLYENIREVCRNRGNAPAIRYFGAEISYSHLIQRIDSVAEGFRTLGVGVGDVVTLMLPNTPENVVCMYALSKIGSVACFVDLREKGRELTSRLEESHSKVVVGTDMFAANIEEAAGCPPVENVVIATPVESAPLAVRVGYRLREGHRRIPAGFTCWRDFEHSAARLAAHPSDFDDADAPVVVTYTSGTTGRPKGVVLSSRNLLAQVAQYRYCGLEFSLGDVFFSQVPPFLAFNAVMATNLPLSLGLCVAMRPEYDPPSFARNMVDLHAQHSIAGPADWTNFLDSDQAKDRDLGFMKTLASGASHLDAARKRRIDALLAAHGCKYPVIEGYGLSEASTAVCTNLPQINVEESVGIPLPKTNICVWDNGSESPLSYDEEGELCFSGPTVMKGYLNNGEATSEAIRRHEDGALWLHTGDLGHINTDGVVFVSGRIKRLIVDYMGFTISPAEIEAVVNACPHVRESCVVGAVDDEHPPAQKPVAVVVLDDAAQRDESGALEVIWQRCRNELIELHQPKQILVRSELPLTSAGKVDYRRLEIELGKSVAEAKGERE